MSSSACVVADDNVILDALISADKRSRLACVLLLYDPLASLLSISAISDSRFDLFNATGLSATFSSTARATSSFVLITVGFLSSTFTSDFGMSTGFSVPDGFVTLPAVVFSLI